MPFRLPNTKIYDLDRTEIAIEPRRWRFALQRREEIERYFAQLRGERPGVWNGRVVLLDRYAVSDRVLRGACFETDYASFSAWRSWDFPDPAVANVFAAAALQAADGAYLVGEMAPYTAAAGLLYFPAGTPEPDDVDAAGTLDLGKNLQRELKEETGLDIGELAAEAGWRMVVDGCYVALLRRLVASQNADELRSRILRHLARERQPELCDIRILRGPEHLDPRMPNFVIAFLEQVWRQ